MQYIVIGSDVEFGKSMFHLLTNKFSECSVLLADDQTAMSPLPPVEFITEVLPFFPVERFDNELPVEDMSNLPPNGYDHTEFSRKKNNRR
jgi:hypothetical protein